MMIRVMRELRPAVGVILAVALQLAQACPGDGGPTCSAPASAPASQPATAAVNVGAGNPINIMTGNKYQREDDLPALPGVLGLEIVRHYNSRFSGAGAVPGVVGRGWKLSYETELAVVGDTIQVFQADGSSFMFRRDLVNQAVANGADPANGSIAIRRNRTGRDEYLWRWADGRELSFDQRGKLVQIKAATGEILSLMYDAKGLLVKVTDPQGRSLRLSYLDRQQAARGDRFRGVQGIDSPVGRFSYEYGNPVPQGAAIDQLHLLANLVRVRYPAAGEGRQYHYEDAVHPTYLTGITIEGQDSGKAVAQRYATFGYQADGRAVLSTHANDVDKVTLNFERPGLTVVTNSLGQQTSYRYATVAGDYRLLEVRGAGCALCGPANERYGYDQLGRLVETTRLDRDGAATEAVRLELDQAGRPLTRSRIVYRQGKPGMPRRELRYEYASASGNTPSLIARPSVVAGQEYVTRIALAPNGLPERISEQGYVPAWDGKSIALVVRRQVSYRYDGRAHLLETDGTLENDRGVAGPDNSDITRNEYDAGTGLLRKSTAPGHVVTEILQRDDALRPLQVRISDGYAVQTITTRRNWRGQPETVTTQAQLVQPRDGQAAPLQREWRYRYNAMGQLASIVQPGGLSTSLVYDAAGRLTERRLPDGSRLMAQLDSEGRKQSEERRAIGADDRDQVYGRTEYHYDELNRLVRTDGSGANPHRYGYSAQGMLKMVRNAMGIETEFDLDDNGRLLTQTQGANGSDPAATRLAYDSHGQPVRIVDPNGVATERRYDDFGNKIMESSPDRGVTLYRYDAAGRLLARGDDRAITRYRYDFAGRLLALGSDTQPELVRYRYLGMHLEEVLTTADGKPEHAVERTQYQANAFGQQTVERHWIGRLPAVGAAAAALPVRGVSFTTVSSYDEHGRLAQQLLPDGHRLQYRYVPSSQRGAGQLQALLFDDRIVVTDIEQSEAGGLTAYLMGNGVRQHIALDSAGRTEQIRSVLERPPADGGWLGRVTAWLGAAPKGESAMLYRQKNSFDDAGRLLSSVREVGGSPARSQRFEYDQLDRLAAMITQDGASTHWRYDRGGNRIAQDAEPAGDSGGTPLQQRYAYVGGSNRLGAIEADGVDADSAVRGAPVPDNGALPHLERAAWLYAGSGVPQAQLLLVRPGAGVAGKAQLHGYARRIVYGSGNRPLAVYQGERLLASYRYNSQGERIARTDYGADAQRGGRTTYNLYRDQKLAAEADDNGRITAHYIYLGGRAIAKIEMTAADGWRHRLWRQALELAGQLADGQALDGDSIAHIYAIQGDHLGTPQLVTDEAQQVVWQADIHPFGAATVVRAALRPQGGRFELALRLPGQVYDAATGLHYNYARDYDPQLGRYTTPDPMGLAGGINPYAYAGGNPLTNIDPLGLYQIDVHYYTTYFLAIAAGVDQDVARRMALATQYVDDNAVTQPMLPGQTMWDKIGSAFVNQPALERYHFVEDGHDPSRTIAESAYHLAFGGDLQSYIDRRIQNPASPQLQRLLDAVGKAKKDPNANCNSSIQLFGEYLHTFEDTFAHRDQDNNPYDALTFTLGTGHFTGGENPDYTYNHTVICCLGIGSWNNNAARTLEMEKEVFKKMQAYSNPANKAYSWSGIAYTMQTFNEFQAHDSSANFGDKIAILDKALNYLGYKGIQLAPGGKDGYDVAEAAKNRGDALNSLKPSDYVGTILPQGTAPLPK